MKISSIDDLADLPIVQDGKGIWQNEYHRHDVWNHTIEVVRILKQLGVARELIAAGWLHDVGKAVTKSPRIKNGIQQFHAENHQPYYTFPDHERVGKDMVRALPKSLFKKLELNQFRVAKMVGNHFLPMSYVKKMKSSPNFEFFCKQVKKLSTEIDDTGMCHEVLTIFYADKASQNPEDLEFLLGLWKFILLREGDLTNLFGKFKAAYIR